MSFLPQNGILLMFERLFVCQNLPSHCQSARRVPTDQCRFPPLIPRIPLPDGSTLRIFVSDGRDLLSTVSCFLYRTLFS